MQSNSLILLRGLPGSGKTTLAHLLSENGKYPYYSVDDYFTDEVTGAYSFVFKSNYLAYKQCEERTREAMHNNQAKVIVHNTFTINWELEIYFKLALEFKYAIFVCTVENYHAFKNIHDIHDEQLKKMAEKYKVKLL